MCHLIDMGAHTIRHLTQAFGNADALSDPDGNAVTVRGNDNCALSALLDDRNQTKYQGFRLQNVDRLHGPPFEGLSLVWPRLRGQAPLFYGMPYLQRHWASPIAGAGDS